MKESGNIKPIVLIIAIAVAVSSVFLGVGGYITGFFVEGSEPSSSIPVVYAQGSDVSGNFGQTYINQIKISDSNGSICQWDSDGTTQLIDYNQEVTKVTLNVRLDGWYADTETEALNRITVEMSVMDNSGVERWFENSWSYESASYVSDEDQWWITIAEPDSIDSATEWTFDDNGTWALDVNMYVTE